MKKARYITAILIFLNLPIMMFSQSFQMETRTKQGIKYYLVLPKSFHKNKKYYLAIGLHGLGGNGSNFARILGMYSRNSNIILICPDANLNYRGGGLQWGYRKSDKLLLTLLKITRQEFKLEKRVLLFGFSQGANQAIYSALNYPKVFTHLACMSGGYKRLTKKQVKNSKKIKILFIHGNQPPAEQGVKIEIDKKIKIFKKAGAKNIARFIYPGMPHTIAPDEPIKVFKWFLGSKSWQKTTDGDYPKETASDTSNSNKNKADINAKNKQGWTRLHIAVLHGLIKDSKALIANGADVNIRGAGEMTPIFFAVLSGQFEMMRFLIKKGAGVDVQDIQGDTPLHYAFAPFPNIPNLSSTTIVQGRLKIIKFLIKIKGNNINIKNKNGNTPLHYAAVQSNVQFLSLLLDNGADVNAKNKSHASPLHYAALSGHEKIVRLLIKKGANVNAKALDGNRPLDLAKSKKVKKILIKAGAKKGKK